MFWIGKSNELNFLKYLAISILLFSVPAIIANMSEEGRKDKSVDDKMKDLNPDRHQDATIQTMWIIDIIVCGLSTIASIVLGFINRGHFIDS